MGWLPIKLPLTISLGLSRKTLVRFTKLDIFEMEVCETRGVRRERPLWRTDKLDFYHLLPDGRIEHTSG